MYLASPGAANESNVMRLGSTNTSTFMGGVVGVNISGTTMTINNAGQVGILASSGRYKKDITNMNGQSDNLSKLRPVIYRYKEGSQELHYGFIAEEVEQTYPNMVVKDAAGDVLSLQYTELIALMVNDIQKLQTRVAQLEQR